MLKLVWKIRHWAYWYTWVYRFHVTRHAGSVCISVRAHTHRQNIHIHKNNSQKRKETFPIRKLTFLFFLLFFFLKNLFYMHWCEGVRSPGTGVTDSGELPRGWWELNPGLLKRAASAPNCRAISLVPKPTFLLSLRI